MTQLLGRWVSLLEGDYCICNSQNMYIIYKLSILQIEPVHPEAFALDCGQCLPATAYFYMFYISIQQILSQGVRVQR